MLAERDFRRLFGTRLISQAGDGMFTAGLGAYVFFNATSFPDPVSAAGAFAVLYLPYSLIGPFAGVFIDRWSRRQILVWSALIRAVFVTLTASLVASGNLGVPLYAGVLAVLGVNRFFLSSLSAAMPHVVAEDKLVMANSVAPTAGTIIGFLGGFTGLGIHLATGGGRGGSAATLLVAGACYLVAGAVAATMRRDVLGPDLAAGGRRRAGILTELRVITVGLAAGARHVLGRRRPAAALLATGCQRMMYGILFLMSILLYRNYFYHASANTALSHFTLVIVAAALGYGSAAVITPVVSPGLPEGSLITIMLAVAGVACGSLGPTFSQVPFYIISFALGLAAQSVAITATTIIQREVDDVFRGRVFSFYDMLFNVPFVIGAAVGAAFMPFDGKSYALVGVASGGYLLAAVAYSLVAGQLAGRRFPALAGRGQPLCGRPAQQLLSGPLLAQRAMLDAQVQQVPERPPDRAARRHPQDAHDLVAVQVGPQAGQFFLLAEFLDPVLEAVVGPGQPGGLGLVSRGAVCPGQGVQAGEQGARVPDVAADGGVGPLARPVAVEPQVQEDQGRDVLDHRRGEAQLPQPLARHGGALRLVVVERDPPVGQPGPGLRLADVVQQRRQPQHQVAVQPVPRLQRDRLLEHGERVLVHVLVPEMLVSLEPEPGHFGQHLLRHAGVDQQDDAPDRVRGEHELGQLVPDPLGRRCGPQPPGQPLHRAGDLGDRLESELRGEPGRAQDAQRVVGERLLRRARRPQHLRAQVAQAAERIHQLPGRQPGRHRVHREVAPSQVRFQRVLVPHRGLAGALGVALAAVGGDLELLVALAQADGAEVDPDGPAGIRPAGGDLQHLLRRGVRGQVEIPRVAGAGTRRGPGRRPARSGDRAG